MLKGCINCITGHTVVPSATKTEQLLFDPRPKLKVFRINNKQKNKSENTNILEEVRVTDGCKKKKKVLNTYFLNLCNTDRL